MLKLAGEQPKRVKVPRFQIFLNISYSLFFFYQFDNFMKFLMSSNIGAVRPFFFRVSKGELINIQGELIKYSG